VKEVLSGCPSRTYVLVQQDGVSSSDYADGKATPLLASYMNLEHAQIKGTANVSDVVGRIDIDALSRHLQSKCGAERLSIDIASRLNMDHTQDIS
jgi:hypothetical protein